MESMELSTLNRDIAPLASDVHPDLRVKCSPRVYETAGFRVYAWLGRKRKQKGCEICFLGCWKTFIISIFVNALWDIVMLILDLRWSGNICIPCSGFFTGKLVNILIYWDVSENNFLYFQRKYCFGASILM